MIVAGWTTFACVGLYVVGQLSEPVHQLGDDLPGSHFPSRSWSTCDCEQPLVSTANPSGVNAHWSDALATASPSASGSQTSPVLSWSQFSWLALEIVGQLSQVLAIPSLSVSVGAVPPTLIWSQRATVCTPGSLSGWLLSSTFQV